MTVPIPPHNCATTKAAKKTWPVAYLAARFPALSETFVYREVLTLRAKGWPVCVVSLHPLEASEGSLAALAEGVQVLYGPHKRRTLWMAIKELVSHPICSFSTLADAAGDALYPGEPLSLVQRMKLLVQSLAGLAIANHLRWQRVRHIHCHFAHAPATVGMYAARQLGIGFSFTGHANDIFQRRALLKRKCQRAAFVACISRWHRAFYSEIHTGGEKYRLIRCGVDTSTWVRCDRQPTRDAPVRILTVCRLVEKKGVDTLIRALHQLSQRHQCDWQLTIAGDGPDRARLEALAHTLGCADSIRWAGTVDNERVRDLMLAADLFVLSCRPDRNGDRDGIPVVLMEAMASGLPVIAGDLPAIHELVEDGTTGLLIDGNDADALAGRLYELCTKPDYRRQLAAAGRQRVEEEFSLERNISRLEAAFRDVLTQRECD